MTLPATPRLRRSVLYVPGANPRALEKAASLRADALILDLEDAVLPEAKDTARDLVVRAVRQRTYGAREVVVRINGPGTTWAADDLRAASACGADAILLPKVESAAAVIAAAAAMERFGAPAGQRLWAMAETPRGVLDVAAIADSSPRLAVLVMGTADLAAALRLPDDPSRAGLVPALCGCVLAARASGVDILDGVFADLADTAGFRAACIQGRSLGFDGKTVIHPGQIDPANEVFGVSAAEAASAAELVYSWEAVAAAGAGVAVVNGRMVERLHVEDARRRLALYRAAQEATSS